jgi:hypothetical protein
MRIRALTQNAVSCAYAPLPVQPRRATEEAPRSNDESWHITPCHVRPSVCLDPRATLGDTASPESFRSASAHCEARLGLEAPMSAPGLITSPLGGSGVLRESAEALQTDRRPLVCFLFPVAAAAALCGTPRGMNAWCALACMQRQPREAGLRGSILVPRTVGSISRNPNQVANGHPVRDNCP